MKRHLNEIPLMIMASHELQEIAKYCNRCIVLNKGEIDFDGTVDDAIQQYVERNERKPEKSIAESKALELLSIEINSPEGKLLISDEIRVSIVFHKRIEDDIDLVVYVRNNYGQVLTDCEIYRPDYVRTIERIGQYELSFSIPKHVLNVGHYFVDLAFGNGAEDVLSIEGAIKFEIIPDEWEKDKLWNQNPLVPTRPHLKWSKRLIE
jgi:lipopolysaccharide transport system ATP-binding protein